MLATQIEVSDGTLHIVNVGIEFFEPDDISVSLDQGAALTVGVDYLWISGTSIAFQDTVNTPSGLVPDGVSVVLRRMTKNDEMYNVYDGGAPFNRQTLDENFEQLLLLSQEFKEGIGFEGFRNNLDMHGFRVVNVGDPVDDGDAANKGYVDEHVERALRIPLSEPALAELPPAATRANKLLSFDAAGLPIVLAPAGDSATQLALDLANVVDPDKGVSMVGRAVSQQQLQAAIANVSTSVDTKAMLRLVATSVTGDVVVRGHVMAGDKGGGRYWYDPADSTSPDNNYDVIISTGGKRWKLLREAYPQQFGAKFDDSTDDTAALQAAYDSLPRGQGVLIMPAGIARFTTLNFDSGVGVRIQGAGALGQTILRCTGSGTTGGIKLRSSFDCSLEYLHIDHIAGFTGYLVDFSHKAVSPTDTQGGWVYRCTFASVGYNLGTAKGINLDKATLVTVMSCKFLGLLRPIDGQNLAGGSYSTVIRILYCQFFDNVGYAINGMHEQWLIMGNNFQACADGAQRIAFNPAGCPHLCCTFITNSVYDALAAGTSYLMLDAGKTLTLIGNMWGGRSDLGASTCLNATGLIQGIFARANRFSLFTNVFVPGVSGNIGWDIGGGNDWSGSTTYLNAPQNVLTKNLELNVPSSSLKQFSAGNWIRYNLDGSIEMGGVVAVPTPNVAQAVAFPLANFPTRCWDVQLTSQGPASATNKESLDAAPTATGFTLRVQGTGAGNVRWRAIGE